MNNYIAFLHSGLREPGLDNTRDGEHLAGDCLAQLDNLDDQKQFPPQLLILLTSPYYLEDNRAAELLTGIRRVFESRNLDLPSLIGTSVAAVFFDRQIHKDGALLICLASRLIDAKVAVAKDAVDRPEKAVNELLAHLNLNNHEVDLNPMSNRMLLTFFPDIRKDPEKGIIYSSAKLHEVLWKSTLCRIPIAGGISSSSREKVELRGLQFANWEVLSDSLVAAQIDSGVPLGVSLCRSLERIRDEKGIIRKRVLEISEDGEFITKLDGNSLDEIGSKDILLLSEDTTERDLILAISEPSSPRKIKIIDRIQKGDTLQVLRPQPQSLLELAAQIVGHSSKRVRVRHPQGCLSLICSAHYRSTQHVTPYIERAITNIEEAFDAPCVGGFVDGEAGVDETGRSQFGNWSMAGIVFGDEMRDRTPRYRGFKALADYNDKLTEDTTLEEAVGLSLDLVFEIGFPGAMISLVLPDQDQDQLVPIAAVGPRFIQQLSISEGHPSRNVEILRVLQTMEPTLLRERAANLPCVTDPAIRGQYVIPLRGVDDAPIAILQIDLGIVKGARGGLLAGEEEILLTLGAAVGAGLNRIFNLQVANTARKLDEALADSLSANTVEQGLSNFVLAAVSALGAEMGHVRIAKEENNQKFLELVAGNGPYYELAQKSRSRVYLDDGSPTCEAYYSGSVTIANDSNNNPAHQRTIERATDPDLKDILKKIGSCANVALKDVDTESTSSENHTGANVGTIHIVSTKPWFFTLSRQRSLKSLARRAGFLLKHLNKKEDEAEAHKRIEFLVNATPQLSKVRFADMGAALQYAISHLCEAARADFGALYLLDKEINKYVLRAQYRWAELKWFNVARFETEGGWLWNLSQQSSPEYYPELVASEQCYANEMFGTVLRPECRVEAIGLPLTIENTRLGILALYRKKCPDKRDGFATTAKKDLAEASDSVAALVEMLFSRQDLLFREKMQVHFREISDIFRNEDNEHVLVELCQRMREMFACSSVDFFFDADLTSNLTQLAHYSPFSRSERALPDYEVQSVLATGDPIVLRANISSARHRDFAAAASDGLPTRVCIPVSVEGTLRGVFDLAWDTNSPRQQRWEIGGYRNQQLRILGNVIGSSYGRYRLAREKQTEREQKEQARRQEEIAKRREADTNETMSLLLTQSNHHTVNLLEELWGIPNQIRVIQSSTQTESLAVKVEEAIERGSKMINRTLEAVKKLQHFDPRPHSLNDLVREIFSETGEEDLGRSMVSDEAPIQLEVRIQESISVFVDELHIREAFFNIAKNAIEAIRKTSNVRQGRLRISASENALKSRAEILFEDTGPGMSLEQIEAANTGFLDTPGRKGVGLLVASAFIRKQGGNSQIQSDGKSGTTVRVVLPLNPEGAS